MLARDASGPSFLFLLEAFKCFLVSFFFHVWKHHPWASRAPKIPQPDLFLHSCGGVQCKISALF